MEFFIFTTMPEHFARKLHRSIANGNINEAKEILDLGKCNINAANQFGNTPLICAAHRGNVEMCKLLVSYGANVSLSASNSWTPSPLVSAVRSEVLFDVKPDTRKEMFDFLLRKGARVDETLILCLFAQSLIASGFKSDRAAMINKGDKDDYYYFKRAILYGYSNDSVEFTTMLTDVINKCSTNVEKIVSNCSMILKEVQYLAKLKVNCRLNVSVLDFLMMPERTLSLYVNNCVIKEICIDGKYNENIVHYKDMIVKQYEKGVAEKALLDACKESMFYLTAFKLPDLCYDELFVHLSNKDMNLIIEAKKESESRSSCGILQEIIKCKPLNVCKKPLIEILKILTDITQST